jgi:hypothetical protein
MSDAFFADLEMPHPDVLWNGRAAARIVGILADGLCPPTFFLLAPQTDKSWKMHDNDLSE